MRSLFCFLSMLFLSLSAQASFDLLIEGGAVWQNRNDVQIPPTSLGSRVELDNFGEGPFLHYRLEAYYRPSKNHGFRLMWAPFSVTVSGVPTANIEFNGATFNAGQAMDFSYTFNSYRASYFYAFWGHGDSQLNLGFTAKLRQAETKFEQNGTSQIYDNLGFVPLLYFEYQTLITKKWFFNFQFDGLAGGPGRAFDVALKVKRSLGDRSRLGFGYRTLEGGADNDEVFTFSWINYAVVDYQYSF